MEHRPSMVRGFLDALVFVLPIVVLGTAYGALAVDQGLPGPVVVLSSAMVASIAAQFTIVALLASGWGAVLVTCTGLAVRHLPMSAILGHRLQSERTGVRVALSFVLVDETFGLTVSRMSDPEIDPVSYKVAADALLYGSWIASTGLGVLVGLRVVPDAIGIEVILPLLYVALASGLAGGALSRRVVGASAFAALVAVAVLPATWQVSTAAVVGSLAGWQRS